MEASMRTPTTAEESVFYKGKPSTALLRAAVNQLSETSVLDCTQLALDALEDTMKSGDVSTTCEILQVLTEQYSKTTQIHCSTDLLRHLWNSIIDVFKTSSNQQIRARASQLIEVFMARCKTCLGGDSTLIFQEEVVKDIVKILKEYQQQDDIEQSSHIIKVILTMSRCLKCRNLYNNESQNLLQHSGIIEALMESLNQLIQSSIRMPFDPIGHKMARLTIADITQTLHYICFMNTKNLLILASMNGFKTIKASIEDNLNELTVQEHGCMILSELAISAELSMEDMMECITTVKNVARVQMQEKYIEVARAAIWSLTRIAKYALHPKTKENFKSSKNHTVLLKLWPIMQEECLQLVVGMMQSCQLKNDLLVKHCLDFIAAISGEFDDSLSLPNSKTLETFHQAYYLVNHLLQETKDFRIKAVSLQTMYSLVSNPHVIWTDEEALSNAETLYQCLTLITSTKQPCDSDLFLIQVFALNILLELVEKVSCYRLFLESNQFSQYTQDILRSIEYIVKYIVKGGEELYFEHSHENTMAAFHHLSCYKHDCHYFLREPCKKERMMSSMLAAAELLLLIGNDVTNMKNEEGYTILHMLAGSGLERYLKIYLEVNGEDVDLNQKAINGVTTVHLAQQNQHFNCASILESESHHQSLDQNKGMQSLTGKEEKQNKHQIQFRKQKRKQILSLSFKPHEVVEFRDLDLNTNSLLFSNTACDVEVKSDHKDSEKDLLERKKRLEGLDEGSLLGMADPGRKPNGGLFGSKFNFKEENTLLLRPSSSSEGTNQNTAIYCSDFAEGQPLNQAQTIGTSISVGSRYNNYAPDPVCPPAGPYEDHVISDTILDLKGSSESRTSGDWQSLYTEDLSQLCMKDKWSMLSSSSGHNNQITSSSDQHQETIEKTSHSSFWAVPENHQLQRNSMDGLLHSSQSGGQYSSDLNGISSIDFSGKVHDSEQQTNHDDLTDDKQIISWMSSEIFGLIDDTSEKNEGKNLQSNLYNIENFQSSGGLHGVESYDSVEDPPYVAIDPTISPFCFEKSSGRVPYIPSNTTGNTYVHPMTCGTTVGGNAGPPWMNSPLVPPPPPPPPTGMNTDPRFVQRSDPESSEGIHPSRFWHTEENDIPSKHLWLGNLNTRLPRSVLKSIFEEYGPIEDVVTFPGRMYAFVNFIKPEDAQKAAKDLDNVSLPVLTGSRKLVIKFRPNRKALGRVGDLMPGVTNIDNTNNNNNTNSNNEGIMPPSVSVPVFCSNENSSLIPNNPPPPPGATAISSSDSVYNRFSAETTTVNQEGIGQQHMSDPEEILDPENANASMPPCRHLWLGNVCLRPSKIILFSLFSRYGPVQSVRVFPGKTFAFVNFWTKEHATKAKEALDQKILPAITGSKPLVVRFQREGAAQGTWARTSQDNTICNIPPPPPPLQSSESLPGDSSVNTNPILNQISVQQDQTRNYIASLPAALDDAPRNSKPAVDPICYESFSTQERQPPQRMDLESFWNENGNCNATTGAYGISCGNHNSTTAMEASSIGELTRTLSAAAFGRPGNRLMDPITSFQSQQQQTQWPQSLLTEGCYGDHSLNSDYGIGLHSSFSGGPDGKGYFTPFRNPSFAMSSPWLTENSMEMLNQPLQQNFSGHALDHQNLTSTPSVGGIHSSLPEELLMTNSLQQHPYEELETTPQIALPENGNTSSANFNSHHGGNIW